jgi:hypothetical protein
VVENEKKYVKNIEKVFIQWNSDKEDMNIVI